MKSTGVRLGFSLVALQLVCVSVAAQSDPPGGTTSWKERLLSEAPKAWAKVHVAASRLQGSRSYTASNAKPKKEIVIETNAEFKQAPGCALWVTEDVSPSKGAKKSHSELSAANTKYRFKLSVCLKRGEAA